MQRRLPEPTMPISSRPRMAAEGLVPRVGVNSLVGALGGRSRVKMRGEEGRSLQRLSSMAPPQP